MTLLRTSRQTATTLATLLGVSAVSLLTGCSWFSSPKPVASAPLPEHSGETLLRNGDQLQVRLDTGGPAPQQTLDMAIDENGEISLPLVGSVKAEGLTPSQLRERVEANYVPRFFVRCNVTVQVGTRFFYVGGEVRGPARYGWNEDVTLLKAINTAGGFTDFANRRKVELVRGGQRTPIDFDELRRNPTKDVPIQPGDSIWVPRSIF